ncbi:Spermatogenesis-associated serine-rich protein 2 [Araneus ventricosus]|uniref:Spermatogenesis-associated serine-rich protein 2 n=1 Tax=Araneus ventricosus TaxID=182803 RepID=A0A4Y2JXA6_ARAVE|nr:Spermatogenesis-associated serine-rich protein 2 [Araneus ventricosus]
MSKGRGCKEGLPHDPSINMPTEQKASESNKQKIAKIHDMFPSAMKDNIAKILQFYDDDESKAVDALTRDGGREALSNWADSNSLKSKNNKNKKKKKKAKKDSGAGITATASFDADDSSSLHSGGNVEADGEKECPRTENGNGILPDVVDEPVHLDRMLSDRLSCSELEPEGLEYEKENKLELKLPQERNSPSAPEAVSISLNCDRTPDTIPSCTSPLSDASERQEEQVVRKEKYRSSNESSSKPSPRQSKRIALRCGDPCNYKQKPFFTTMEPGSISLKHTQPRKTTSSFRRSKSSSISEDSSSQHNPQAAAAPTKRGYDKCKKDLNRQTISLQRIYALVEKGFEEASKKAKTQFSEIQKLLEKRQKEMELHLDERKQEAFNLCKSRQDLAVELKRRLDRTASLSEAEWTELRSDVKQFVTERKYDDELGKTIWFQWEDISQVISNFGEVPPVKNVYSQRSHSALGHSGASNNPEPSPSSSLANEENESSADKNDVGNISDTAEDETPVPEKMLGKSDLAAASSGGRFNRIWWSRCRLLNDWLRLGLNGMISIVCN